MFRGIGPWEIGLVLVIILIVFGVGRLPQVGTAIGKGIRGFRKATRGEFDDENEVSSKADTDKKQVES
ncbi:MAG: twin-arginine translocase TatA/TatE family subunit [Chloroflexota bacterium]|nr:twin-arginine translocase TatA/TatE family subunit [Chloroflexota bacterium]